MARPFHTEEHVQETRRRLCEVALGLYRAEGYDAVTLRDIGAAAGMSHATPYRYFESKEDLFLQVRAAVFDRFGEFLACSDPGRGDPLARLRRIVLAMVEFAEAWPADYRLIFSMRQPATTEDSPLGRARREVIEHVTSVCQAAIDAGQITGDANTQVHIAWAGLHGLLSLHVSNHLVHGRSLQDLVQPMIDHLFAPMVSAGTNPHAEPKRRAGSVVARVPSRAAGAGQKRR